MRKFAILLSPDNIITQEIQVDGEQVTIQIITPLSTVEHKAPFGVEFKQYGYDERPLNVSSILYVLSPRHKALMAIPSDC